MGEINGDRVDRPPCSGLDPYHHRHGSGCLPIIRRHLPTAPAGWRWGHGRTGPVWSFYLERIGGGGAHWLVVDCPTADTAGALAVAMWSYCQGYRHDLLE